VLATPPPPRGGQLLTSCCAFAACAYFQVISCVPRLKVRVYLSCWAWSDFPTGGGAPGLLCLAASMCTHPSVLLDIYSEATAACMRPLMCTAVSQLRSGQLVPLHHHAHFMYPACLFFLYMSSQDSTYVGRHLSDVNI
jgi:hypothetical protein